MKRSIHEMIIDALGGAPITDLVDNWTFTIREVAPYVFNTEARDINGHITRGAGGTAEEALNNCLKSVKRIISFQSMKLKITDWIKRITRIGK